MKNFKKNIGKFFRKKRRAFEPEEINPRRDWRVAVAVFVLLNVAVIIFNIYAYREINKGGFFSDSEKEEIAIESIDRSELAKAVEFYDLKEKIFQESKFKKTEIVDPSL